LFEEVLIGADGRYPPDTEEKGKKLGNFFQTKGAPPKTAARIPEVLKEIEKANPSIKTWGIVGVSSSSRFIFQFPPLTTHSSAGEARSSR
jgi:hypothetical protein